MEHIENEEKMICLLLNDRSYVEKLIDSKVDIKYFDDIHSNIVSATIYANNNGTILTRDTYKHFLTTYKKSTPAELAAQITLFNRCLMKNSKVEEFSTFLEKIKLNFINRKTSQFFQEYKKEKEKIGTLGANNSLSKKIESLNSETENSKALFVGAHDVKETFMKNLYERRNNKDVRLECGIKEIDDTMNVGFKNGHLTVICAPIGEGKTTTMCNMAANLFERYSTNIMYIPLEMPNDEIFTKLVARETQISLSKIEHAEQLSEDDIEYISKTFDKWKNQEHKFNVLDIPERAKVSTIRKEIESRISYFKPKVIFVDYSDNLVPDYKRSRPDEEMNDMLQDLRKMGKALGFHVVTAAQLSKDYIKQFKETKEGKQNSADSTSIRGGLVYTMNADSVYAQLKDPMMPNERLIFMCIKSRHGSTTFGPQNNVKTHLMFKPEIALVESMKDIVWEGPKDDGLLDVVARMPSPEDVDGSPF